jgi:hypothetical protein
MVISMPARKCQFHGGEKDEHGFLAFCGKPVKEGYSYCIEHHRRVYQRVNTSYSPRVIVTPEAPVEAVAAEAVEIATPELEREAA